MPWTPPVPTPDPGRAPRAAQYVRMSTEFQRYSLENQTAGIAAFAASRNLTIVRTYQDKGHSGLRFSNRQGLQSLINDVEGRRADFDFVLVYDVSRWGRFQDVDESAHYEFICRQAGVRVLYCAEQFENDGSFVSAIMKNIKRVSAGDYSRELSAKVFAGSCRLVRLGFKQGGIAGYGLERVLIDQSGSHRCILARRRSRRFVGYSDRSCASERPSWRSPASSTNNGCSTNSAAPGVCCRFVGCSP